MTTSLLEYLFGDRIEKLKGRRGYEKSYINGEKKCEENDVHRGILPNGEGMDMFVLFHIICWKIVVEFKGFACQKILRMISDIWKIFKP